MLDSISAFKSGAGELAGRNRDMVPIGELAIRLNEIRALPPERICRTDYSAIEGQSPGKSIALQFADGALVILSEQDNKKPVLYASNDDFGRTGRQLLDRTLDALNLKPGGERVFDPDEVVAHDLMKIDPDKIVALDVASDGRLRSPRPASHPGSRAESPLQDPFSDEDEDPVYNDGLTYRGEIFSPDFALC